MKQHKENIEAMLLNNNHVFQKYTRPAEDVKWAKSMCHKAQLVDILPYRSKLNSPAIRLIFEFIEGKHAGEKLDYYIWLTDRAKRFAKRDLLLLGFKNLSHPNELIDHLRETPPLCQIGVLETRTKFPPETQREIKCFELLE